MSETPGLEALRRRALGCTACELYRRATQTVFGTGPSGARIMLIGEQPGDHEDLEGMPFVGPAGQLLDRVLQLADIDRSQCYVTNVVKHFKWEPRGKRRLHKTPAQREINACRQWLEAEVRAVQPAVLVCLGATAAKALLDAQFRVSRDHGQLMPCSLGPPAVATTHPSALLRMSGRQQREQAFQAMVADLQVARALRAPPTTTPAGAPP